jgi:hypothetical protein
MWRPGKMRFLIDMKNPQDENSGKHPQRMIGRPSVLDRSRHAEIVLIRPAVGPIAFGR